MLNAVEIPNINPSCLLQLPTIIIVAFNHGGHSIHPVSEREPLTGYEDYAIWKPIMRNWLKRLQLWDIVSGESP